MKLAASNINIKMHQLNSGFLVSASVACLALSEGGFGTFGKRHSHKMIKFILIIYFHGTKYYQSIFLFLKNVRNIYYTYYTTLY